MCCNGSNCGDDCDDSDPAVHPGARELCNGRDDDCNGTVDDAGATPLCPGGTCVAGHCNLMAWSRTFGGPENDAAISATMDDVGNVYIIGYFSGSASFGSASGPVTSTPSTDGTPSWDPYVVSYGPDGSYRWVYTTGTATDEWGIDIAFDPVSHLVYATYMEVGTSFDATLVALDLDGNHQWDRTFASEAFLPLSVDAYDGPVVSGGLWSTHDFGGPSRTPIANGDLFVARYAADGTYIWDYVSHGTATASISPQRVAIATTGAITVAGYYTGGAADFGAGPRSNAGGKDMFALALDADGALSWDYVAGGTGDDESVAVRVDETGTAFMVGSFADSVDFGGGAVAAPAAQSAFLMALDSGGTFQRITTWGGGTRNEALAVAFNAAGDVLVAGTYSGTVNFGGGLTTAPDAGAAVLITFDSAFNHRRDQTFAYAGYASGATCSAPDGCGSDARDLVIGPADSTAIVGLFSGNIDFGSDVRMSAGYADGYVLRLAN